MIWCMNPQQMAGGKRVSSRIARGQIKTPDSLHFRKIVAAAAAAADDDDDDDDDDCICHNVNYDHGADGSDIGNAAKLNIDDRIFLQLC